MAGARYYIGDEMERFFGDGYKFVPTKDHVKNMINVMIQKVYYVIVNDTQVKKNSCPLYFTSSMEANDFIRKMDPSEIPYAMLQSRNINDFEDLKRLLGESEYVIFNVFHLYKTSEIRDTITFYSQEAIKNLGI